MNILQGLIGMENLIELSELSKADFCTMSKESINEGIPFEEKLVVKMKDGCELLEWTYKGNRYLVYTCECDKHPLFISPSYKIYKLKSKN